VQEEGGSQAGGAGFGPLRTEDQAEYPPPGAQLPGAGSEQSPHTLKGNR